ncbi:PREDICTED: aspartyl/asparaginyl beta-hydroxylase-like, partial [Chrysochloris asiatica]|uniref:Aspartyl/asparaginyl beta-hydroxylase-like n=1 Tax=Chrysochloris asiatica TaxID=185453 RepID=A0A9B0X2X2_CHRAS
MTSLKITGLDNQIKHGGQKNGKKRGLSGSSFFTWFMVIALLGVWTSVAVVWFDLIDYEEVLAKAKDFHYNLSEVLQGKLGLYDADGDGDFDVDDAKILLEGPSGVAQRKTKAKVKELIKEEFKKEKEKPKSRKEHKNEERKKEKKDKDDLKDRKIADSDIFGKEFTKSEKERVKGKKVDHDKTAKTKDTKKKLTNIKVISSKMVPRDKDDPKENRRSIKHAQLT